MTLNIYNIYIGSERGKENIHMYAAVPNNTIATSTDDALDNSENYTEPVQHREGEAGDTQLREGGQPLGGHDL